MISQLIVSRNKLESHFREVEKILQKHANMSAVPKLNTDWLTNSVVSGIVGAGCEVIHRNRGRSAQVAPAWAVSDDIQAWIGYREEWVLEPPAGATSRYSFKSTGVTIHFGSIGELNKPQMFRAEWSGYAKWSGDSYKFQAGNAGHPHWQFDAIDSLSFEDNSNEVQNIIRDLKSVDSEQTPREFSEEMISSPNPDNLTCAKKLSRIHFASAAPWWKKDDLASHAHSPGYPGDISKWLDRSLIYISEELVRLK